MNTVLRANLVLLIVVVLLIAVTFVMPFGLSPLTYLEPFTFSMTRENLLENRWLSAILNAVHYVLAALLLLSAAFSLFGDRSRHTAE